MNHVETVNGNLLDAKEDYIVHQCNCVSTGAKTLAEQIFKKYPYANTYLHRIRGVKNTYDKPGTIEILGNGKELRYIVNMYSQFYPSVAKYGNDTKEKRVQWFKECLHELGMIEEIGNKTFAMPYLIGCGAAGGDWETYKGMIEDFANEKKVKVVLYKLE